MSDDLAAYSYYSEGELIELPVAVAGEMPAMAGLEAVAVGGATIGAAVGSRFSAIAMGPGPVSPQWGLPAGHTDFAQVVRRVAGSPRFRSDSPIREAVLESETVTIPTETLVVDGARSADIRWVQSRFGVEVAEEGRQGKVLLRVPADAVDPVLAAFSISRELYRRPHVRAAHPNFVRVLPRLAAAAAAAGNQWNHENPGSSGLAGADVHARAAWTLTRGNPDVVVAVLDEGVDTVHPALQAAVRAERDFAGNNPNAWPDADDAHGTACAGIIASRSSQWPGLAPEVGLAAARIARGDGAGRWIIDDFDTADAIDWAWEEGEASVLSNSWSGGPPVDSIRLAFQRARTQGRGGRGAVVVVSAGNDQVPVGFPGTLRGVLTVGASNQWDEPKTRTSRDGETWWGTNFGEAVRILAPGVQIPTTDITGPRGYGSQDYFLAFNGTSAAAPHVAAAAALVLTLAPQLSEKKVRDLLVGTAERLPGQRGLSRTYGRGRLNAYAALRAARRV